jgi:hypothetical protein
VSCLSLSLSHILLVYLFGIHETRTHTHIYTLHYTAMARFARDCLDKFKETGLQLEAALGDDTLDMGLRVGMHSGK